MKSLCRLFFFATLSMMLSSAIHAAEEPAQPPMDPALMEKMKALNAPTEAHQALEPWVGKWTYAGKFWMTPDAEPQDMTGTALHTMIYGGRFLKQEIEGPWMGETFQGVGFTGHDNIKDEYVSIWIDSMGTGIMTMTGQYDPTTKTLSQSGTNSCPLTGEKARPGRSDWSVINNDNSIYSSYLLGPDGKEFKAMEITYSRVQ